MTTPAAGTVSAETTPAASAARLNILVLDEYFPYPPDSGKPIRTWNLLRHLATRHNVTLLCHGHLSPEQSAAASTAGIRVESVDAIPADAGPVLYGKLLLNLASPYPYSVAKHFTARFRKRLHEVVSQNRFDLVHCEWTPYARYLADVRIPSLVAMHNIESQIWARRAERSSNPLAKLFFHIQAAKMERFERRVLAAAGAVTGVSRGDTAQATEWGARQASVVDNGVDLEHFSPRGDGDGRRAIFVGALDWFPNVDAVQYFADAILPELMRRMPEFKTRIIGRKAPDYLQKYLHGRSGVEFVGEVPDTRSHLADAGIVIVPLRIGGGSRLKILEALAMGKAVVSTTIGAEGLEVTHGKDIILADAPADFAKAIAELADDRELRKRLGNAGRALVERRYGWEGLSRKAEQAWLELAKREVAP